MNNPLKFTDPDGKDILAVTGGVKFTGNDALIAFSILKNYQFKAIHFVYEKRTKNIYQHTLNAFRNGKPEILHYDTDLKRREQRRYEALKKIPSPSTGNQRDEYPYASTYEGGKGAMVLEVPTKENSRQGNDLKRLYRLLDDGDAFLVLPIPEKKDLEPSFEVMPVITPTIRNIPNYEIKPALIPLYKRIFNLFPLICVPCLEIEYSKERPGES